MTDAPARFAWSGDLGFGVLAIIAVAAASVIGQLAMYPNSLPGMPELNP